MLGPCSVPHWSKLHSVSLKRILTDMHVRQAFQFLLTFIKDELIEQAIPNTYIFIRLWPSGCIRNINLHQCQWAEWNFSLKAERYFCIQLFSLLSVHYVAQVFLYHAHTTGIFQCFHTRIFNQCFSHVLTYSLCSQNDWCYMLLHLLVWGET